MTITLPYVGWGGVTEGPGTLYRGNYTDLAGRHSSMTFRTWADADGWVKRCIREGRAVYG